MYTHTHLDIQKYKHIQREEGGEGDLMMDEYLKEN